jgi:hypothetical protein
MNSSVSVKQGVFYRYFSHPSCLHSKSYQVIIALVKTEVTYTFVPLFKDFNAIIQF